MDESVVAMVLAYDEILWRVLSAVIVAMVYNRPVWQRLPECALGHDDVLENITGCVRAGVLRHLHGYIGAAIAVVHTPATTPHWIGVAARVGNRTYRAQSGGALI